jgi:predicted Rossmann fold flavoprotein
MLDVAIIGGGAAGFFTAINLKQKQPNLSVSIFEKSKSVLSKVAISGGGRCNVTHACFDTKTLCTFYPRGSKELLSVFERFNPSNTINWFELNGVKLKVEADGRMFPVSDDSQTIISCLLNLCTLHNIKIYTNSMVQDIVADGTFKLKIDDRVIEAKNLVIASGSSTFFWDLLKKMGHSIVNPVPSLFTFNITHNLIEGLQGLSLPNAEVSLHVDKQLIKLYKLNTSVLRQSGPLLVTHWGLSGPSILKLSSIASRLLNHLNYKFEIGVNLAGISYDQIVSSLNGIKSQNQKKLILKTPAFSIPTRLWQRIIELNLLSDKQWINISNKEFNSLIEQLFDYRLKVEGKSVFKEEFVTAGGVDLKEINFKSMESKIVPKMFLAGEVLNIDALTGGFNFQAAWSESWVISESIIS